MNGNRRTNLLHQALIRLKDLVPDLQVEVLPEDQNMAIELRRPQAGGAVTLDVQVELGEPKPVEIINKNKGLRYPGLFVADYFAPEVVAELRRKQVFYLDTAGNAYLDDGRLFIRIEGQKRPAGRQQGPPGPPAKPPTQAFGEAGVRLIFAFLNQPGLINRPYREIKEIAGVAQGTITHVLDDLEKLGFYQKVGKERLLRDLPELLEQWTQGYEQRVRAKQLIGRYRPDGTAGWWKEVNLNPDIAMWGGEPAGALLTDHYLRPATATIYTVDRVGRVMHDLRLRKDPDGPLELLRPFWNHQAFPATEEGTVPYLVAYADLMATGEARCIETAQMIYEQRLQELVRES